MEEEDGEVEGKEEVMEEKEEGEMVAEVVEEEGRIGGEEDKEYCLVRHDRQQRVVAWGKTLRASVWGEEG